MTTPRLIHAPNIWLVPTFYGDIRLTSTSDKTCTLIAEKLTARETAALRVLEPKARSKGWIKPSVSFSEGEFALVAPIAKVSQVLARALKPERTIVSAVKFADGKIEEVTTASFADGGEAIDTQPIEASVTAKAPAPDPAPTPRPEIGTSIAAPVRGCVSPEFLNAEIKARRVLEYFLDSDQREDFRRYNRFVSVGADTGHRYMITSRHAIAHSEMAHQHASFRSLYDLDEQRELCVHDWAVPAAEEMLGLHLMLRLPTWETYVRQDEHDLELATLEQAALILDPI